MFKFKLTMQMMLRWCPIALIPCYPAAIAQTAPVSEDPCRQSPSMTVSLLSSSKQTKANQKQWRRNPERSRRSQVCLPDQPSQIPSFNLQGCQLSQDLSYPGFNPKLLQLTSLFCFHYLMSFKIFLNLDHPLQFLSIPGNFILFMQSLKYLSYFAAPLKMNVCLQPWYNNTELQFN